MAGLKAFKTTSFDDKNVTKLQSNLDIFFEQLTRSQILDGILLKEVSLLTGSVNLVDHKLGRKPLGYIITRKRATADIWDAQDDNTLQTKTLNLECSADVVVDIWVF